MKEDFITTEGIIEMDYKLRICQGGTLKVFKFDDELAKTVKIRKRGEEYHALKRGTGEFLWSGETEDEVREKFWVWTTEEENVYPIWRHMRINCEIELGVTLGDIYKIIEDNAELEVLVEANFPLYRSVSSDNNSVSKITFRRDFIILNTGNYREAFSSDHPVILSNSNAFIEISSESNVYDSQHELIYSGKKEWHSLLEILQMVFSSYIQHNDVVWRKEGYLDNIHGDLKDPFHLLFAKVLKVEEPFTLKNLFDYVDRHETLKLFLRTYCWCFHIDDFHEEAKKPPANDNDDEKLYFLNLAKYIESDEEGVDTILDLTAGGKVSEHDEKYFVENPEKRKEYTWYAVEMTPVNNLAGLQLKMDTDLPFKKYTNFRRDGSGRELLIDLGTLRSEFTLIDFLDCIYDEISFFGTPTQRQAQLEDIQGRMEEIEDGTAKLFTMEEMMEEFRRREESDEDED